MIFSGPGREIIERNETVARAAGRREDRQSDIVPPDPIAVVRDRRDNFRKVDIRPAQVLTATRILSPGVRRRVPEPSKRRSA
jgi:hypothetical protein